MEPIVAEADAVHYTPTKITTIRERSLFTAEGGEWVFKGGNLNYFLSNPGEPEIYSRK